MPADDGFARDDSKQDVLRLEYGFVRHFGSFDLDTTGQRGGWAVPEAGHNWNDGPQASLVIAAPPGDGARVVVIEGVPHISAEGGFQDLTVYGNGLRLGFWRLTRPSTPAALVTVSIPLPPAIWQLGMVPHLLQLDFYLPGSQRLPEAMGHGDARELGFCFRSITLQPGDAHE